PVTTSRRPGRSAFTRASARMASIDSSFAGSMKLHVLTTRTSAASGSRTSSWPRAASTPSITSLSTWFFGQPSVTRGTRRGSVTSVRQLDRDAEVPIPQRLDHGLEIVLLLAGDSDLVALDRRLNLELRILHELHDLARLLDRDALLEIDLLLRGARGSGLDGAPAERLQGDLPA